MKVLSKPTSEGKFRVRNLQLQSGVRVPSLQLAYETFGQLNNESSNVILLPTWFCSKLEQNRWLIGQGMALDPQHWFIVSVALLGNGQSGSPSNFACVDGAMTEFPAVSVLDNVRAQRCLLHEVFGVRRLALVAGRSMGGQVAFQWASYYADDVDRMFCLAGSSVTSPHNFAFLAGVKAALQAAFLGAEPVPDSDAAKWGLKAAAQVFAAWNLSPAFYKRRMFQRLGASSVEAFLTVWERNFLQRDIRDVLTHIGTWQAAHVGANEIFGGDQVKALQAIQAQAIVMGCDTDQYFPVADNAWEVSIMPRGSLRVIRSDWGHRAGSPGSDLADIAAINEALAHLLACPAVSKQMIA